jgi:hypothetical protein
MILDQLAPWSKPPLRWFFIAWLGATIYCPLQALAQQQPTPCCSPIVWIKAAGTGSNYAIIQINVPQD